MIKCLSNLEYRVFKNKKKSTTWVFCGAGKKVQTGFERVLDVKRGKWSKRSMTVILANLKQDMVSHKSRTYNSMIAWDNDNL